MREEEIPEEEAKGPETRLNLDEYLEWKLLSEERTLIFHGTVRREEMIKSCTRLTFLAMQSKEPIKVILNSVGGEVYSGLLVFDTIKELVSQGVEVVCEARGLAASMGTILMQAATKRICSKHTRFLIHEVSSWSFGKASEMEDEAIETKKVNRMLAEIIAEKSKKTVDEVLSTIKRKDYWLSAEEALEFGLIDEIV